MQLNMHRMKCYFSHANYNSCSIKVESFNQTFSTLSDRKVQKHLLQVPIRNANVSCSLCSGCLFREQIRGCSWMRHCCTARSMTC